MGEAPVISVQNVSKCYAGNSRWGNTVRDEIMHQWYELRGRPPAKPRETWALRDVSFELQAGNILGIIGHNGAGKSTLLKILAGITVPSSGRVVFRGRRTSILEIGTGFHPDISGRQNVFLAAAVAGIPAKLIRQRFDDIVDFSGIGKHIDFPVKHYSSGMYLRLAFSVAFFTNSEILLLDEVLSVGDLEFRNRSTDKIREIAASGATVVLASHELQAVKDLCTHTMLLSQGQVQQMGKPKEIIEHYLSAFYDRYHSQNAPAAHTEWPKSEAVELVSVQVHARGKSPDVKITMDDIIDLDIRYRKIQRADDLDIVLSISDYENMLLSDCPIYRREFVQPKHPAGLYHAEVSIPANLLNEGTYYIHLIFGDKKRALLAFNYLLKFQVHLSEWEMNKKWNEGVQKTPLRPQLGWQITREE